VLGLLGEMLVLIYVAACCLLAAFFGERSKKETALKL
jgi:hypothetical protein